MLEAFIRILENNRRLSLSRYRPFCEEFLRTEIEEGKVYLWFLRHQNDPCEGRYLYDYSITRRKVETFLTKHENWATVREYRFVLYDQPPGLFDLPDDVILSDVSLGCHMSEHDKQKVVEMVRRSRFSGVRLWNTIARKGKYGLERESIAV
jgi:hypothetical protein